MYSTCQSQAEEHNGPAHPAPGGTCGYPAGTSAWPAPGTQQINRILLPPGSHPAASEGAQPKEQAQRFLDLREEAGAPLASPAWAGLSETQGGHHTRHGCPPLGQHCSRPGEPSVPLCLAPVRGRPKAGPWGSFSFSLPSLHCNYCWPRQTDKWQREGEQRGGAGLAACNGGVFPSTACGAEVGHYGPHQSWSQKLLSPRFKGL